MTDYCDGNHPSWKPCPTPCDDDCEANCHEAHHVPWKRQHEVPSGPDPWLDPLLVEERPGWEET